MFTKTSLATPNRMSVSNNARSFAGFDSSSNTALRYDQIYFSLPRGNPTATFFLKNASTSSMFSIAEEEPAASPFVLACNTIAVVGIDIAE